MVEYQSPYMIAGQYPSGIIFSSQSFLSSCSQKLNEMFVFDGLTQEKRQRGCMENPLL